MPARKPNRRAEAVGWAAFVPFAGLIVGTILFHASLGVLSPLFVPAAVATMCSIVAESTWGTLLVLAGYATTLVLGSFAADSAWFRETMVASAAAWTAFWLLSWVSLTV